MPKLTLIPIPVRLSLLTPTRTVLRMTHDSGVLAVKHDILDVVDGVFVIGEVGAGEGGFHVVFREACLNHLIRIYFPEN